MDTRPPKGRGARLAPMPNIPNCVLPQPWTEQCLPSRSRAVAGPGCGVVRRSRRPPRGRGRVGGKGNVGVRHTVPGWTRARTRTWRPDWPCPVAQVWGSSKRGVTDPTYRVHRAPLAGAQHPAGPVDPGRPTPRQRTAWWWPWRGDRAPRLCARPPAGIGPAARTTRPLPAQHPLIGRVAPAASALAAGPHPRVWDALVPVVIEQKVTGQEATTGSGPCSSATDGRAGPGRGLGLRAFPSPRRCA